MHKLLTSPREHHGLSIRFACESEDCRIETFEFVLPVFNIRYQNFCFSAQLIKFIVVFGDIASAGLLGSAFAHC